MAGGTFTLFIFNFLRGYTYGGLIRFVGRSNDGVLTRLLINSPHAAEDNS